MCNGTAKNSKDKKMNLKMFISVKFGNPNLIFVISVQKCVKTLKMFKNWNLNDIKYTSVTITS